MYADTHGFWVGVSMVALCASMFWAGVEYGLTLWQRHIFAKTDEKRKELFEKWLEIWLGACWSLRDSPFCWPLDT